MSCRSLRCARDSRTSDGIPIINVNDVPLQGFNKLHQTIASTSACRAWRCVFCAIPLGHGRAAGERRTSPGPMFYRQERMGLDGKQFTIYKFLTDQDAEAKPAPVWARDARPAVHAGGSSAAEDEIRLLPQLRNVFVDMSLVGPRPSGLYSSISSSTDSRSTCCATRYEPG